MRGNSNMCMRNVLRKKNNFFTVTDISLSSRARNSQSIYEHKYFISTFIYIVVQYLYNNH